jgi:hypothetical protein
VVAAPAVASKSAKKAEPKVEPPVAEPQPSPAPVPAAASVAESVLLDHPEPAQPAASHAASPEVPSPGLQPGSGTPTSPDTPPR